MDWKSSKDPVLYADALAHMQSQVAGIQDGSASEQVWLLEHPHLFTAGTSASETDIRDLQDAPIFETGRGGKITYHGPGQRVGYVMLDLNKREKDLRKFVWQLEDFLIRSLRKVSIIAERREGRIGLWVWHPERQVEEKIAAIGVRVQKWVTFHGFALNINPDLSYFNRIVPCGIADFGVTSMHDIGINISMREMDSILKETFEEVFRETQK